jgi:predicted GNAT superfamily acetyltransferase
VTNDAWELARDAASRAGVELGPLTALEDAERILDVMIATWGEHQLIPREILRAMPESGNVPYGAFEGDRLVGYVLGWAGVDPRDGLHIHSHMLAVRPDLRHAGVGYALKLAQRAAALDQGISLVRWTFDPMIARNAYFNLCKLGAVCDRFERNFYGEMADALNRGERSDRFVVRWDLERTPGPRTAPDGAPVEIPRDHPALRLADPDRARRSRDLVADALEDRLARGLIAVAFDRDRSAYLFSTQEAMAP